MSCSDPLVPDPLNADLLVPDSLDARRSVPARQLDEPAPEPAVLLRILRSAVRVPDHGKRIPFRFIRIAGDTRIALGEFLVQRALELDPDASTSVLDKDRGRLSHAPLVLVVVAKLGHDEKIPESERLSTAACVCFALLIAVQQHGFGAQWLTGWPAYDIEVMRKLGLDSEETIAGFIHIGTPKLQAAERERPNPATLLTDLRL